MIYYPLSTLLLAGIRDILIITTPEDQPLFEALLKDGNQWGVRISYAEQPHPGGLAQAFIIGRNFIGKDRVCLILGDNVFYGDSLVGLMKRACQRKKGATVFGYWVKDPENYGVAEFDSQGEVVKLIEKPKKPKSNYAITGLYFYDNNVLDIAENLKKSGAFVPGIRPGQQTANYIDSVVSKLTLVGAFYLCIVCLLPELMIVNWNVPFYFGGTSLLIIVVVLMDLMGQVQSHLMSQQYESLMKKTNLTGGSRRR